MLINSFNKIMVTIRLAICLIITILTLSHKGGSNP